MTSDSPPLIAIEDSLGTPAVEAAGVNFASRVACLTGAALPDLRNEWRRVHPALSLPSGLPRDLLVRMVAWREQEREFGAMPPSVDRRLDKLAAQLERSGSLDIEREVSLKPGTKLIRDWHGRTCRVLVLEEGYLFEDRHYASLSHVARAITGTRWSGPRFFGLKQRRRAHDQEITDV